MQKDDMADTVSAGPALTGSANAAITPSGATKDHAGVCVPKIGRTLDDDTRSRFL